MNFFQFRKGLGTHRGWDPWRTLPYFGEGVKSSSLLE